MLAQVSNMLQSMAAAAERVFEFLDEEEEIPEAENTFDLSEFHGNVEFDHVRFGYTQDKVIIHDLCSSIKAGQTAGNRRAYRRRQDDDCQTADAFLRCQRRQHPGRRPRHQRYEARRSTPSLRHVLQDTWLFKGTIMENIRYGRLDATDEEVIEAAKAANAHHFIQTLPGGYQMELNEEASNVSQGQKQLLTIARAILADNKIMILDEATSSVDTRTETRIQQAMNTLMEGRTSFVIAIVFLR